MMHYHGQASFDHPWILESSTIWRRWNNQQERRLSSIYKWHDDDIVNKPIILFDIQVITEADNIDFIVNGVTVIVITTAAAVVVVIIIFSVIIVDVNTAVFNATILAITIVRFRNLFFISATYFSFPRVSKLTRGNEK